ncbi:MAG: ATP-grasp domain-containing protein [Actinobacteria bacterium]|nr:ATP-grasp domain-containing protein [Actinomycetota bacterium]MBV8562708.1 ATP-grasp domain-containing protein [Actinomycetota bacterium]
MRFAVVAHRSSETNARIVEAAAAIGLDAELLLPREALHRLEAGDVALGRLDVREGLDGVESGTTELERLAAAGVHVLNTPAALVAAHDKLLTARVLRLAAVPHPHTWLLAEGVRHPDPELPLVLKPRFGSWGRDVVLCRTRDEVDAALASASFKGWFREHGAVAQELVPPLGWDLRVVVAGGRIVGSARRVAMPGEWRTNAALGARVEPAPAPPLARTLALAAAAALRLDLAGVDLLPTRNGFVVLEVNGAVDFRPAYVPGGDVFADAVLALLRTVADRREPALAAL